MKKITSKCFLALWISSISRWRTEKVEKSVKPKIQVRVFRDGGWTFLSSH